MQLNKPFLCLALSGALLLGSHTASAQTSPAPATYSFAAESDYAKYDAQVIETVNWLEKTPVGEQTAARQAAGKFFIEWLTGTPAVSVMVPEYLMKLCPKDTEALLMFMGGWSRYQLQHPEVKDGVTLNTEGLKTLLQAYQLNRKKPNKKLDELLPMLASGTLSQWVAKEIKS